MCDGAARGERREEGPSVVDKDIPATNFDGLPGTDVFGAVGQKRRSRSGGGGGDNEPGGAPVKSCALVSNSGALKKSGLGSEVDAHDVVFRFNNAPTKGYEKDVGEEEEEEGGGREERRRINEQKINAFLSLPSRHPFFSFFF